MDPLVEEPLQRLAGDLFEDASQVRGQRVPVGVLGVVGADSPEKGVVSQDPPEHVQDPTTLCIVVAVEELEQCFGAGGIDDRSARDIRRDIAPAALFHPPAEVVHPVRGFKEEGAEVRREALGQPQMGPVGLGRGVAEPLVGDFVGHRALAEPAGRDRSFRVEDGRRVLHAAELRRGLDVRELLEGVRPDGFGEEVDHFGCARENLPGETGVVGVGPEGDVDASVRVGAGRGVAARSASQRFDGEFGGADHHGVGGMIDRGRPAPRRLAVAAAERVRGRG